ncbi:GumC family protein [Ferrimonas lipolytica]|uniref:Lipopolysaccharide biosynthesis protein n=1 Tax=Ferrimonas lipolytica TaxID=2724191 RepID=A0A6H1UBC6_9GAMM|nr:hypothetical protein [Ferrimonas lipolytica]QIZ76361.1 hypothetical protein HER31_05510 [Ferrimonas lipolytica]
MSMTYPIAVRTRADSRRAALYQFCRSRYVLVAGLGYALVVILVTIYLLQAPRFHSDMALVLPGSGSSSNFSLEDVGQASAQTKSPFSGGGFNPRVNYKEILTSRDVIRRAANNIGLDETQFGDPRVTLTEQTSILAITVAGSSALGAEDKAWSLYQSFQQQLDNLRSDEVLRHSQGVERVLTEYEAQLAEKRRAVVEFQQRSLLVSSAQMEQTIRTLTELKEKRLYAESELTSRENFVRQLSLDLGVSPALAGQAFALNTDTQFRGYMRELDDSSALITRFSSHWGENHPKVKAEQQRLAFARTALFQRSASLIGEPTAELLHTMDLSVSPGRAQLFADLVDAYARAQGDQAKIESMVLAQQQLQDRLKVYARESAELERLQRQARLAEAVYTSAAARLEAGQANIFASYPVVQMLTPPAVPTKQRSPNPVIAIAAALFGFILITVGVLIAWQRHYLIKQLLKRS